MEPRPLHSQHSQPAGFPISNPVDKQPKPICRAQKRVRSGPEARKVQSAEGRIDGMQVMHEDVEWRYLL